MTRRQEGNNTFGVRAAAEVSHANDGKISAREGAATTVFTVESLGLKETVMDDKKGKGKGKGGTYKRAATTVLAGEAAGTGTSKYCQPRRHVTVKQRTLNLRFLSHMASYDAVSDICQAKCPPCHRHAF